MKFKFRRAALSDVNQIVHIMTISKQTIQNPDWFVADDKDFIKDHISNCGFILAADTGTETVAFALIRFPYTQTDNLGKYLSLSKEDLNHVCHIETIAVLPEYRGNHLQKFLIEEAIQYINKNMPGKFHYFMATVHPDNTASLHNFLNTGFKIITTVKKYGGLTRHILFRHNYSEQLHPDC